MEFVIVLAIIATILFVVSGGYKSRIQDPETLRSSEIEDVIIELKKKILVTSVYENKFKYEQLYYRLEDLMRQVLMRHQHFVLNIESEIDASGSPPHNLFYARQFPNGHGARDTTYIIPSDLDLSIFPSELLIYACFLLWYGGNIKRLGSIYSNPERMAEILDFLISERNYSPAIFMKGMVYKYGLRVYSQCFPSEAKKFLENAKDAGIGSAAIELENLTKFNQLTGIKSVALGEPH